MFVKQVGSLTTGMAFTGGGEAKSAGYKIPESGVDSVHIAAKTRHAGGIARGARKMAMRAMLALATITGSGAVLSSCGDATKDISPNIPTTPTDTKISLADAERMYQDAICARDTTTKALNDSTVVLQQVEGTYSTSAKNKLLSSADTAVYNVVDLDSRMKVSGYGLDKVTIKDNKPYIISYNATSANRKTLTDGQAYTLEKISAGKWKKIFAGKTDYTTYIKSAIDQVTAVKSSSNSVNTLIRKFPK